MKILRLLVPLALFCATICRGLVLDTPSGKVKGTMMRSRKGTEFHAFRGIPYAKPPVDELRFKAPVAADNWDGILDATEDANVCIQKNYFFYRNPRIEGSEDCLYLNVYTPMKTKVTSKLLPVMVYIHYGGFIAGSSKSTLLGPKYLLDKNVILVTFNYRLGIFGFYSTVDDSAWGNWALKDQVLALKWVQKHISSFGGNPNAVTIFGTSAGAGSVHHHILSPSSKGLFDRAISQSGSALSLWAKPFNVPQQNVYKLVANASGCNADLSTKEVVECMREVDADKLIEVQDAFKYFSIEPLTLFTFVIEEKTENNPEPFLTEDPAEIIREGNFNQVPWIIGVVSDEGMLRTSPLLRQADTAKQLNENFDNLLPQMFLLSASVPEASVGSVWDSIKEFFLNGTNVVDRNDTSSVQGFTDMYSDRAFMYGSYQSALFHSFKDHRPIWFYVFGYKGKNSFGDVFAVTNETINVNWGVSHCDELIYLFDSADLPFRELKGNDLLMSKTLVRIWTDFAKFGNPANNWSPIPDLKDESNISNHHLHYLNIPRTSSTFELRNDFLKQRMTFWQDLPLFENIPEIKTKS